ncbi:MAG TPA: hypothetical protein VFX80_12490, partial [Solirubrobacteraceae bacterium]|nr:hypothetical protein [Solirubrobacteraceae bacterium]
MRTLGDVLASRRRRCFVGRDSELELVRNALGAEEPPFALLWFTGPGGIGKSSLLEVVAEFAEEVDGLTLARLDGRHVAPSPRAVLDVLDAAISAPAGRIVLLIDAYERLDAIDGWVRSRLLPRLPATALTVVAGRRPPGPAWRADSAWRELLRVVALRNLSPDAGRSYLRACGVDDAVHERLLRASHGHPLGLSLLAEVAVGGGEASLDPLAPDPVGTLVRRFVDVVPAGTRRDALEVCALSRTTTESLLRDTLALDDAHDVFAWLRDLSFVESGRDGLVPHELARDVLDADLRWRDPERYKDVFRAVSNNGHARLRSSRGRDQQRAAYDLKFLFRNLPSVVSPVDWEAWAHHDPEPAGPDDGERILELVSGAEGAASAAIAERWLALQPEAFVVVHDEEDDVRGMLALLDLTAATEQDRRADPGAAAAWDHAHRRRPPRPGETITQTRFVVDRDAYQGPSPTLNVAPIVTLQRYLQSPRLAWDFLALHEPEPWDGYFALADLPRASGADFVVGGRRYGLFAHDFRHVPVDALARLWTERALAQEAVDRSAAPQDALALSHEDFTDAVRQALRDLNRADLLARNPLLRTRLARDYGASDPEALAELVRAAVDTLHEHPRDDKLLRAVERTYLRPAPTQEAAAELLGL